jgi:acetolactate synthase-1/3 small subunit
MNIVEIFRGKIIDVSRRFFVIEATGSEDKINALIALLKPIGIKEIVRTGRVAMFRGSRLLTMDGKDKERAA